MRILHLVHQYLPEKIGGTELYTQSIAHALTELGHQVSIFYRRSAEGTGLERRDEDGVAVWAAWNGPLIPNRRFLAAFGDPILQSSFERVLDEVRPELVHVEHLMGLPVASIAAIRRCKLPFVVTLWDFWWICANAQLLTNYDERICNGPRMYLNCGRCALARARRPQLWPAFLPLVGLLARRNQLLRRIMATADRLIAPTEFVRRWYTEHGTPAMRLITLPPALENTPAAPLRSQHDTPVRFVYIGGLSWQKGVHVLVEAFADLDSRAELWIAGDEAADPAYAARLRSGDKPGVRFLGRLNRAQVWETLAQADVVAVPTLWYETFSFIISEAFAAGAPVIASRLGPLADRVQDGVNGLLLPPGDVDAWHNALLQLSEAPELRAKLRAGIRPPLTLQEHAVRLEGVYTGVLR